MKGKTVRSKESENKAEKEEGKEREWKSSVYLPRQPDSTTTTTTTSLKGLEGTVAIFSPTHTLPHANNDNDTSDNNTKKHAKLHLSAL